MKFDTKKRGLLNHPKKLVLLFILIVGSFLSNAQYVPEAFVTKWKVPHPLANSQPIDYINLIPEGAYHYELFKLDGNNTPVLVEEGSQYGAISFTILEEDTGTYILSMIPDENHPEPLHRFMMSNTIPSTTLTSQKLIDLIQWGTVQWYTFDSIMCLTTNLEITANDLPNLTQVTSMVSAFEASINLVNIPNMNQWDVSRVENMQNMFRYAVMFNEDISNWNVASVTNMSGMFHASLFFNQDIGNWNVSNVTDMHNMFNMGELNEQNFFNQDIGNWDVSNVTNMGGMFSGTRDFNQDIGNWNVSNVTNMSAMFLQAHSFNQDIGNWNVSNVTDMHNMFSRTKVFNQDIGNWDVSNVINMSAMFTYAENFNQDIGNWNVENVTNMQNMFWNALTFDQDIGNWNVANVTNMSAMFRDAENFNQNLGAWNLNNLENALLMLHHSNMSCENYSLTLKGWSENNLIASNVGLGAANMKYSPEIEQERNHLINSLGWTIVGDALGTCALPEEPIAIQEINSENLTIYPNPVNSTLSIHFTEDIKIQSIQIYNINGQKVMEIKELNSTHIEVSHLPAGMYFLALKDDQHNKIIQKFSKL